MLRWTAIPAVSLALACSAMAFPAEDLSAKSVTIKNTNPLIYYHGRWDKSPGTWWAGSGLKLNVKNLQTLTLNLGEHTTVPHASVGVSVDYAPFATVNVSAGANVIPLSSDKHGSDASSVVRINVEGWQNNRVNLESIVLNAGAKLLPYKPSKLAFQFIGDSLSAGQFLDLGVDQAWPFLVGEQLKAEHTVIAQPGATLTDMVSYGNEHGVSYQFFQTEDTGYFYTTDHNYTTPWDFSHDKPTPTHLVIHIGANDSGQGVAEDAFTQTYLAFLARLRTLYPTQPIFVFTPWGWPSADAPVSYYYPNAYQHVVDARHALGDRHVYLVNTTGWVTYADVFPSPNVHPTEAGHAKIAGLFASWLDRWGLEPERKWATE